MALGCAAPDTIPEAAISVGVAAKATSGGGEHVLEAEQPDSEEIEIKIEALHWRRWHPLLCWRTASSRHERDRLPVLRAVRVYVWELPAGVAWGEHSHPDDDDPQEEMYCTACTAASRWAGRDGDGEGGEDIRRRRSCTACPGRVGDRGEALLLAQGSVHSFRNDGPAPLKLLLVLGRPGG